MVVTAWLLSMTMASAEAAWPRPEVLKEICATELGQGEMAYVEVLPDKKMNC